MYITANKFALIGWNDKAQKRGAYTEAAMVSKLFPDICDVFDANTKIDIRQIHQDYDRVIYTYQNPNRLYEKKALDLRYFDKDIVYIRQNIKTIFTNTATNGFSIYKENNVFRWYIPMMIPMFPPSSSTNSEKVVLGYYLRPQYRPDDFKMFRNFLGQLNYDIDLYVMGSFIYPFKNETKHIKNLVYTTDNEVFFNEITHYVYSMSNVFDPWPTTLQEAVNANKQIIILEQRRNFKDGIDDICENIKYHTGLNVDVMYDNKDSIINTWNYITFFHSVFEDNFTYLYDRSKYKYIGDWLEIW